MSIITFWSNGKEETAKTLSISAIATYMAIEHNFKILLLSTNYNDTTLENCYWEESKNQTKANIIGLGSGIEELSKAIVSNKASPEVITNYTKIVFKNRLEVLPGIKTGNYDEYEKIRPVYKEILKTADKYYDLIFVDLNKGLESDATREILEMSDLILINITQRLKTIDAYIELKLKERLFKKDNTLLLIGRYDRFSKYSSKNIARYISKYFTQKEVYTIPYSTLFFEAANEGKVADFFLRFRKIDEADRNALFISEVKKVSTRILYKLQELQMKT
jgi:MinD-like ATPase involved in chromosome partitioning or flagellar assembly